MEPMAGSMTHCAAPASCSRAEGLTPSSRGKRIVLDGPRRTVIAGLLPRRRNPAD